MATVVELMDLVSLGRRPSLYAVAKKMSQFVHGLGGVLALCVRTLKDVLHGAYLLF